MTSCKDIGARLLLRIALGIVASGLINCVCGVISGFILCFLAVARHWQMIGFAANSQIWIGFGENLRRVFELSVAAGIGGALVGPIFGLATELNRLLKRQYFVWLTSAALAAVDTLLGGIAASSIHMHIVRIDAPNETETGWLIVGMLTFGLTGAMGGWFLGRIILRLLEFLPREKQEKEW